MEWFAAFLGKQQILTLFLVISLGYAIGEMSIAGLSLGVGAVLFVGLAIGALAPQAPPPEILGTVGLIMFFYGVGIQYGKPFVAGLLSPAGQRQNLVAVLSVILGGLATALLITQFKVPTPMAVGIFAGALVNTATLQSVVEKVGGELPSVGYSVAYPFGVFAPIFCIYLATRILKPSVAKAIPKRVQEVEVVISQPAVIGKLVSEVIVQLPPKVQVVAVRQDGHNRMPRGTLRLRAGDMLLLVGEGEPLQQARRFIGKATDLQILSDHRDLDDLDIYVSKPAVIGRRLGELNLAENPGCTVISVQRGDGVLAPHPGLVLEAGDRTWVMAERDRFQTVRNFFGDSARSTAEVSYLALGIGMVGGVLFGLIPFPLPGLGTFTFGAAGGAMIVSLFLGWRGRVGHLNWIIPPSANLTLRNFGLTLFLAVVGLRSAQKFVATVRETGFLLIGIGLAITLVVVLGALIIGLRLMRTPFDDLLGTIAGVTGNPAILAYAAAVVPTNKPELGYAIVFPTSTIIKIIVVQILLALFPG
jgi:putative transport protein